MKELFSLEGRVAVVTGGSSGIGAMISRGLIHYGCRRVYDISIHEPVKPPLKVIHIKEDISTLDGINRAVTQIEELEDHVDILVNNAGASAGAKSFEDFTEQSWDFSVDINMKTPLFMTQRLFKHLKKSNTDSKRLSKVINISSINGLTLDQDHSYGYHASKAGLLHLTRQMSIELIKDGISVNAICPGAFPSNMNQYARDYPYETAKYIPVGRTGTPEDIVGAVIYLASQAGDYVLGNTLIVDGGVSNIR